MPFDIKYAVNAFPERDFSYLLESNELDHLFLTQVFFLYVYITKLGNECKFDLKITLISLFQSSTLIVHWVLIFSWTVDLSKTF